MGLTLSAEDPRRPRSRRTCRHRTRRRPGRIRARRYPQLPAAPPRVPQPVRARQSPGTRAGRIRKIVTGCHPQAAGPDGRDADRANSAEDRDLSRGGMPQRYSGTAAAEGRTSSRRSVQGASPNGSTRSVSGAVYSTWVPVRRHPGRKHGEPVLRHLTHSRVGGTTCTGPLRRSQSRPRRPRSLPMRRRRRSRSAGAWDWSCSTRTF